MTKYITRTVELTKKMVVARDAGGAIVTVDADEFPVNGKDYKKIRTVEVPYGEPVTYRMSLDEFITLAEVVEQ